MPGSAIGVLLHLGEESVGSPSRRRALAVVNDGADEWMAERDVSCCDGHELVELSRLQVDEVELVLPERGGDRRARVGPCRRGKE